MDTPIFDFIKSYCNRDNVRLHMPGHKGNMLCGYEKEDITEISGADSLYCADGIILKSEENASRLFGSGKTLYSCEGSSLSIRAMVSLAMGYRRIEGGYILAGRNAHSSFISACALCDANVKWLCPKAQDAYLSCTVTAEDIENELSCGYKSVICVYITSPDYLGSLCDVGAISAVCKKYGVPLLVDNAHGAYLAFLENNIHPMSHGATMCADSAHKTLPALTGGAYLHISKDAPGYFYENARSALSLFGSTSPSYLILSSLDRVNAYLSDGYKEGLNTLRGEISALKECLKDRGYSLVGDEALKITVMPKSYGYTGYELAKILEENGIVAEMSDKDHAVLMITEQNSEKDLEHLKNVLLKIPKRDEITDTPPSISLPECKMGIRAAVMGERELIPSSFSLGRILAQNVFFCPPAISPIVCGEIIDKNTLELFDYYGIKSVYVVK